MSPQVAVPALGTALALDGPAARIVSLVSSATETLHAIGAAEALVGVTPWCARYVPDLLWLAGLEPVHGERPDAYERPDLAEVPALAPEWVIVFSEPEHPVDGHALVRERGRDRAFAPRVAVSTVERGRNLIHDGPSFVETARWLRAEIAR